MRQFLIQSLVTDLIAKQMKFHCYTYLDVPSEMTSLFDLEHSLICFALRVHGAIWCNWYLTRITFTILRNARYRSTNPS